jgi:hypothetical protein
MRNISIYFTSIGMLIAGTANLWAQQQPIVPGTGIKLDQVGDDFEDPNWSYQFNLPKVFNDKDTPLSKNMPGGVSANGRWFEGMKRGQPDVIRRVQPPEGGLPGSQGALLLCSLRTGGSYPSNSLQQEDFVASVFQRVGKISVARQPSVVTRVWMPPFEEWENRVGQCHFAFRLALEKQPFGSWTQLSSHGTENEDDHFWPGIFVNLVRNPEAQNDGHPYAIGMWMKASAQGRQLKGPVSTQTGWWTMGMSVSADGRVNYFAKPGVDDLTEQDMIGSDYPFGYRAVLFRNFFFNVCNGDNGHSWSSQFVIDDPAVYVAR